MGARGTATHALGGTELFVAVERLTDQPRPVDLSGSIEVRPAMRRSATAVSISLGGSATIARCGRRRSSSRSARLSHVPRLPESGLDGYSGDSCSESQRAWRAVRFAAQAEPHVKPGSEGTRIAPPLPPMTSMRSNRLPGNQVRSGRPCGPPVPRFLR